MSAYSILTTELLIESTLSHELSVVRQQASSVATDGRGVVDTAQWKHRRLHQTSSQLTPQSSQCHRVLHHHQSNDTNILYYISILYLSFANFLLTWLQCLRIMIDVYLGTLV